MGLTSKATTVGNLGAGAGQTAAAGVTATASAAESTAFLAEIQAVQAQANAAALTNARISNEKALTDALGKNIKGTGESVKNLGAQ